MHFLCTFSQPFTFTRFPVQPFKARENLSTQDAGSTLTRASLHKRSLDDGPRIAPGSIFQSLLVEFSRSPSYRAGETPSKFWVHYEWRRRRRCRWRVSLRFEINPLPLGGGSGTVKLGVGFHGHERILFWGGFFAWKSWTT